MYKLLPILLFAYGLAVTTENIYDNSWALIIGIDKYQNVKKLNYAVKDAESIQNILVNSFYFPSNNISILTNDEATKQNILKSFSDITKKAKENDRVLVFFAGHGDTMDLPGGGEQGYLIPVEGDKADLYLTSIPMNELKQIALMSRAKHMLYLVDACYGGLAAIGSRGLETAKTPHYIDKVTKGQARQVITAGGRGEEVIEKSEWGHSAFTLNLMRGLKDGNADMNYDGYITGNELGLFLSEKVTIDSENQQTPQYGRYTSQEGEFVFAINSLDDNSNTNKATSDVEYQGSGEIDYEKLASAMEKNKNKIDLPKGQTFNPNNTYPLSLKLIILEKVIAFGISKRISPRFRTMLTINRSRYDGIDVYDIDNDGYLSQNEMGNLYYDRDKFLGNFYYNLIPYSQSFINPQIGIGVGLTFINWNSGLLATNYPEVSSTGDYRAITYSIFALNESRIAKHLGCTVGIYYNVAKGFDPLKNPGLVVYNYQAGFVPFITIDLIDPYNLLANLKYRLFGT